jgi:uncharacterized membrane protein YjjP (DUF1212 family)
MTWSTDKIIAVGLIAALMTSFFVGADKDLQSTIAVGLIGFLGRVGIEKQEAKKIVEAVGEVKDAAKK